MKDTRSQSKAIRKRFVQAIEMIAKERYPAERESDVIKSIGLTPGNYYRLRSTENNYPTLDQCVTICKKYKISAAWLLLGQGTIRDSSSISKKPIDVLKAAVAEVEMELKSRAKV